jgi:hypothetical protein
MKKYLFGLGAMLVGAGLMFVLMHGEVSAEREPFVCSESIGGGSLRSHHRIWNCKTRTMSCGLTEKGNISCVSK